MAQRKINAEYPWRYPALNELVVTEHYSEDLGALLLGDRRLAADLAYVQFLQYYGTPSGAEHQEEEKESNSLSAHDEYSGGNYPRVKEWGTRVLRLDPFFTQPILEIAGALAFNLDGVDQALELLREAIQRDPSFYRYHLYVAAILYKNNRQDQQLIQILEQAIQFRDCPPLFQNVLGNLLKKYGRVTDATKVFIHMLETSVYEFDRNTARQKLKEILQQNPNLSPMIAPHLAS